MPNHRPRRPFGEEPVLISSETVTMNRSGFDAGFMVEVSPAGIPGFERSNTGRLLSFTTSSIRIARLLGDQRGRHIAAEPTDTFVSYSGAAQRTPASSEGRHRAESVDSKSISPVRMVR
jgi:hypothetical protein